MIKKIFQIKYIIIVLSVCLIISRFGLLCQTAVLARQYISLIMSDFITATVQTDFQLIDCFFSALLLVILPIIVIIGGKRIKLLKAVSWQATALVVFVFAFIFAPVITNENPDFQKNLSVTRLLSPLSSVKVLHLKEKKEDNNPLNDFLKTKSRVVKSSFDESILFCNSITVKKNNLEVRQNETNIEVMLNDVEIKNGEPVLTTKLFFLGTDEYGRDVFTRLIYGVRISLTIGFCSVIISLLIGVVFGFITGIKGGFTDIIISRITEMFLSFPLIFFVILILALFGNSIFTVIFVLGFSGWMSLLKIVKGETVALRNKDYFITAQQLGLSKKQLLIKEALPVMLAPIIVNTVFQLGNVILAESALSFLGLGVGAEYPSWGGMLQSGQENISRAWQLLAFPGMMIVTTLLTANKFGRELSKYYNPGFGE